MEKAVYYLCKETFRMRDADNKEVAFTQGLFYKLVQKFERDGGMVLQFIDDRGKKHNLSKEFKKKIMVKVKDKHVLRMLRGESISLLAGEHYMCKKTMRMRHDDSVAFKKGKVYRLNEDWDFTFYSDVDNEHHMGGQESVDKYLVKIIDQSVLGEQ